MIKKMKQSIKTTTTVDDILTPNIYSDNAGHGGKPKWVEPYNVKPIGYYIFTFFTKNRGYDYTANCGNCHKEYRKKCTINTGITPSMICPYCGVYNKANYTFL